MKYEKKDLPLFKNVICSNCPIFQVTCKKEEDNKNEHWFFMCPHFFNWAIGLKYVNGIMEKVEPKREVL
jgi:hypothetical protein